MGKTLEMAAFKAGAQSEKMVKGRHAEAIAKALAAPRHGIGGFVEHEATRQDLGRAGAIYRDPQHHLEPGPVGAVLDARNTRG